MTATEAGNNGEKDSDMICALTPEQRGKLLAGLGELPGTMPPRAVWNRIREQAEAEGLLTLRRSGNWTQWLGGAGLAAAAALIVVLAPRLQIGESEQFSAVPDNTEVSNVAPLSALGALMVESQQLEDDLRALPNRPKVVRAGTQATILELEDRIAAIDYQLSDPDFDLSADEEEIFWRERVRLMKSLVRLRYAQTQRTAF